MKRLGIGVTIATALVAIGVAQANAPNSGQNAAVVSAELVIQNNIDMPAFTTDELQAIIVSATDSPMSVLTSWNIAINCVGPISLKGVRGDAILPNSASVMANLVANLGALVVQEGVGDLILPNSSRSLPANSFGVAETSNSKGGALVGTELVLTAFIRPIDSTA